MKNKNDIYKMNILNLNKNKFKIDLNAVQTTSVT